MCVRLALLVLLKVCSRILCMFHVEKRARAPQPEDLGWAGIPTLPLTSAMTMGHWPVFLSCGFLICEPGDRMVPPGRELLRVCKDEFAITEAGPTVCRQQREASPGGAEGPVRVRSRHDFSGGQGSLWTRTRGWGGVGSRPPHPGVLTSEPERRHRAGVRLGPRSLGPVTGSAATCLRHPSVRVW